MKKVMVVEDNNFLRGRLIKMLSENGFTTLEAEDGEVAVEVYQSSHPDLTLMDITMPRKDGLEALSDIRQFDPSAKVIMLTALNQESVVLDAMREGAKDFLTKPVASENLINSVNKVLR